MEIKILGWSYKNIRQLDDLEVDLCVSDISPYPISMVMMRNGTGKTTTIQLMRAVLDGTAVEWPQSKVESYAPPTKDVEKGKFTLSVKYGTKVYHYTLLLDFVNGVASYHTSRVARNAGGLELGRNLPSEFSNVLDGNVEFIKRFIFDGEQAKSTLSSDNSEAEQAITYLYQINKLDALKDRITFLKEKKQLDSSGSGKSEQSISNLKTRYNNKKEQYEKLVKKREQYTTKLAALNDEQVNLSNEKEQLINSNEKLREKNEHLKIEIQENDLKIRQLQSSLVNEIKKPYNVYSIFHKALKDLSGSMQTLKLPKTTAKEFFKELSDSSHCICGTPIGSVEKETILKNAERYLGNEQLAALNAIKSTLKSYEVSDAIKVLHKDIQTAYEKSYDLQQQLSVITNQVEGEESQRLKEILEELPVIEQNIFDCIREIEILNGTNRSVIPNETNSIPHAKKSMEEQRKTFLLATDTYKYTMQAELMCQHIERIKQNALTKLKQTIIHETNNKISQIIKNDKVEILRIDGHIQLRDREGVSEGQTLAIAYSYIGSLFEHSAHKFPFIVDSPAAPMDLGVRREVAVILPQLFHQLIIFVTSAEKPGFAEKFYARDDVYFVTIEGQTVGGKSIAHDGLEFFAAYQSEEEE